MAKTIDELEAGIRARQSILESAAAAYFGKTETSALERAIESDKKRITEIIESQVRLGDGTFVSQGMEVWGYYLPKVDVKGNVVDFKLYRRTVEETKKDTQGRGHLAFTKAEKKFQRLSWYDAERFFASADEAQLAQREAVEKQRVEAEKILAVADTLIRHIDSADPEVVDFVEETVTA